MPLRVTSLRLSHFRSHRRAALVLDGRPVALFGANGAGKTNLVEAVSLLSPGRGLRRAATEELIRRPEALGWKIRAGVAGPAGAHEIETWAEPGQSRQVRIDGKAATQTALGRIVRLVWLIPAMDRLWTEAAEGRRRFLDRTVLSFEPGHAEAVLAYEKAMRDRNRLLKDEMRDPHWYEALEAQMADSGAAIIAARARTAARLDAAQREGDAAFPKAALSIADPADAPCPERACDLRAALRDGRGRDMRAGRSLTGPHRADLLAVYAAKGVTAAQSSTGEQKALLLSLILANARALAEETGAPPLLLLDEVAAHLDSDRRAALYAEVQQLGAQAWMTGTGAELFPPGEIEAQRFRIGDSGGTSILEEMP
ncbi:DNA replication/repair protein RecF [Mangrovicoccus algicola]|uniref:DNA replication and repair protein RecF n=1 Tax=Mangrovicoccus algicola TaxID=2771008 RepID=A0A8J6YX45_9RHOB|nr:DNA replication/repair protein RecF [Mangrovicoccus algicola]MBE3637909.1 DNA replication/repair protein RecF [Mangrovicoccus algicola]